MPCVVYSLISSYYIFHLSHAVKLMLKPEYYDQPTWNTLGHSIHCQMVLM